MGCLVKAPLGALLWLGITLFLGCSSAPEPTPEPALDAADPNVIAIDGPRELITRDGLYRVTWSAPDNLIPINQHFNASVDVRRNDDTAAPVEGADVALDCFMPEHGHGMLRKPGTTEEGEGLYTVGPLLLHMDGYWTVSIDVVVDGLASAADDELRLEL